MTDIGTDREMQTEKKRERRGKEGKDGRRLTDRQTDKEEREREREWGGGGGGRVRETGRQTDRYTEIKRH